MVLSDASSGLARPHSEVRVADRLIAPDVVWRARRQDRAQSSTTMRSLCSITKPALCSTRSTTHPVSSRTAWICSPRESLPSRRAPTPARRGGDFGGSTTARANSTMRATPMGNAPASSSRTGLMPQRSRTSSTARRGVPARACDGSAPATRSASTPPPPPRHSSAMRTLSSTREPAERLHPLERASEPQARALGARLRGQVDAVEQTRPSFGRQMPDMTSKSVVFPAPFGPMIPRISPASASKLTCQRRSRRTAH